MRDWRSLWSNLKRYGRSPLTKNRTCSYFVTWLYIVDLAGGGIPLHVKINLAWSLPMGVWYKVVWTPWFISAVLWPFPAEGISWKSLHRFDLNSQFLQPNVQIHPKPHFNSDTIFLKKKGLAHSSCVWQANRLLILSTVTYLSTTRISRFSGGYTLGVSVWVRRVGRNSLTLPGLSSEPGM
jgi:hypothetical protein